MAFSICFLFIDCFNTAVWERRRRETKRLQNANEWPLHIFPFFLFCKIIITHMVQTTIAMQGNQRIPCMSLEQSKWTNKAMQYYVQYTSIVVSQKNTKTKTKSAISSVKYKTKWSAFLCTLFHSLFHFFLLF